MRNEALASSGVAPDSTGVALASPPAAPPPAPPARPPPRGEDVESRGYDSSGASRVPIARARTRQ
jgi:hypothetical protein